MPTAIPFIPHCPRASIAPGCGFENFDEQEIAWQTEVIRENTNSIPRSAKPKAAELQETPRQDFTIAPTKATFTAEADRIAAELAHYAIRRGPSVAWIGLDWLGDSEFSQLVCLGPDLYNGICGIGVFLAAHAAVTGNKSSAELAYAALAQLRKNLKSRNAARMARALGLGGAVGLGSIVYALAVMAKCLHDDDLLADARQAAELFTDESINAMNMPTLPRSNAVSTQALTNGTFPDPFRSTDASAAIANKKVAVNIPRACDITRSRAIHSTSRGE